MAEAPQPQQPTQPMAATSEPPVRLPPPLPPEQKPSIGKKSVLMFVVALLFFAGGLGTWVYVEYFFQ